MRSSAAGLFSRERARGGQTRAAHRRLVVCRAAAGGRRPCAFFVCVQIPAPLPAGRRPTPLPPACGLCVVRAPRRILATLRLVTTSPRRSSFVVSLVWRSCSRQAVIPALRPWRWPPAWADPHGECSDACAVLPCQPCGLWAGAFGAIAVRRVCRVWRCSSCPTSGCRGVRPCKIFVK